MENNRNLMVEAMLEASSFKLNGQANTIRFKPVSPTNNHQHSILFSGVVLLFQRDAAAAN